MKTFGKLKSISRDIMTRRMLVTFECEEINIEELNRLADMELYIEAGKKTNKRSLSANSYFHVLVGKIAEALTISKSKAKNILICKYGQPLTINGEQIFYKMNVSVEDMMENESIHAKPVRFGTENGKENVTYKIYEGSSHYDSYQMSKLIEGTVADAKELGIETLPASEIERMMKAWNPSYN